MVISIMELAHAIMNALTRNNLNQECFIEAVFDLETQKKHFWEDPDTYKYEVARALNIVSEDTDWRNTGERQPQITFKRQTIMRRDIKFKQSSKYGHHVHCYVFIRRLRKWRIQLIWSNGCQRREVCLLARLSAPHTKKMPETREETRAVCSILTSKTAAMNNFMKWVYCSKIIEIRSKWKLFTDQTILS